MLKDSDINPTAFRGDVPINSTLPFYNHTQPSIEIKREKARHRAMCQMSIAGFTNVKIAEAFGRSENSVQIILTQRWAQEFMQHETAQMGEDFRERIIAAGQSAFIRICDRATDELVPVAIKQKDDHALVDRWLGKAVQPITTGTKAPDEMTLEEIKTELQLGSTRIKFNS